MKISKYIKTILLICLTTGVLTTSSVCINMAKAAPANTTTVQQQTENKSLNVKPLSVVNNPKAFLNKSIVMNAKFDKFSTLGLDYKSAFKSSENYISFLIKREDTNFDIPLSEMKLFLKRETAEKFIDLKSNDEIEIKGTVFSDALGDAWIDVTDLNILKKAPEEKSK